MCRSIQPLSNLAPPATSDEIRAAALQYVRKISGSRVPSRANEQTFADAVEEISRVTARLIEGLVTSAPPRDRETEAAKARQRSAARFG
jgi:hypothetical protein